jgi:hypothetical protein
LLEGYRSSTAVTQLVEQRQHLAEEAGRLRKGALGSSGDGEALLSAGLSEPVSGPPAQHENLFGVGCGRSQVAEVTLG